MLNVFSALTRRSGFYCVLAALAVLPASAASRFVAAGGDLQGALNQAQGGDTITIAAGATFRGHYRLGVNNVRQWITIQSSAMSSLPGEGQRVSPAQAAAMPKIVTPDVGPALVIPSGANYYYIQGIEFTVAPGDYVDDLIQAGTATESSASALPHHLVFDRDYIHGDPRSGSKRGLALNSATTTVENSYFSAFTSDWQDTQAICGWNGSGPFVIANNHLEAGSENVAFGGATPSIPGLIPSNIMIQNNEFYKPLSWWQGSSSYAGMHVWAKNHLELKNAQNVIIQNNTFTNNFLAADQNGFMLVFSVRDQGGRVPWATVSNVTVQNNLFQHTAAGVLLMGHDGDGGGTAGNFSFLNNVWLDMGGYGGDGGLYEILNDVRGVTVDHETAFPTGWLMVFAQGASSNVKVTNSIFTSGWGIAGDGGVSGEAAMRTYNPDGFFANNAVIGGWDYGFTGAHFGLNRLPGSTSNVGFVNLTGNDVRLAAQSSLKRQAADGLDLGANSPAPGQLPTLSALNAASEQEGVANSALALNGWVSIVSKESGKCMDLATWSGSHWGQDPSTLVTQYRCHGGNMQQFQFWPVYDGYKITIKLSGQQLDMRGGPGATSPGTPLTQYPYWGGTNEMFELNETVDGYVTFHPLHSHLCLGLADQSGNDGVVIVQQACSGADNQKWKLVPAQ